MNSDPLQQTLTLLSIAVLIVVVFRKVHLPPIAGYLCVGIIAGPNATAWVSKSDVTQHLGEIGVAFLLFTIGLDFSFERLRDLRGALLGLGSAQVAVGTASGGLIAWLLGTEWQAALVVGGALAMSSTAIVIKQLTDQLELHSPHGRLATGVLLFQDLAAVPFLVVIPILAAGAEHSIATPLVWALLKGLAAVALMLLLGHWALRPLLHMVTATRTIELFTLTVLLISLATAWITHLMGLSLVLGAFLAGMMLSETEYRHQVEADIRPFRDVLLGLFFITVGMQLDLAALPSLWPWVVVLVAGLVAGKGLLIALLACVTSARCARGCYLRKAVSLVLHC